MAYNVGGIYWFHDNPAVIATMTFQKLFGSALFWFRHSLYTWLNYAKMRYSGTVLNCTCLNKCHMVHFRKKMTKN